MENELKAITTPRDLEAVTRLLDEVSSNAPPMEVLGKAMQFQAEAATASGAGWPEITPEQFAQAGVDWHVFPNLVFLMSPDGLIAYRSRPDGNDPDSCIFDIWSLMRYAPGAAPQLKREFYHDKDDWKTDSVARFGVIPTQDFQNMEQVQQGMKSSGFTACRTNPLQEVSISNFHQVLFEYLMSE